MVRNSDEVTSSSYSGMTVHVRRESMVEGNLWSRGARSQEVTSTTLNRVPGRDLLNIYYLLRKKLSEYNCKFKVTLASQSASPVAGRSMHFLSNWAQVSRDQWVLDTIQGIQNRFPRGALSFFTPKIGPQEQKSLIQEELHSLLQKGAVTELHQSEATQGFYSSLFLVPKKDGGMRPVVNLKSSSSLTFSKWKGYIL